MNISASLKVIIAWVVVSVALASHAATITVYAAASLMEGMKEIGRDYQNNTGDKIEFNFAASSVLERQIEEGAPADIFFSADEAKMDALERKGLLAPGTRRSRLSNSLVIVIAKDNLVLLNSPRDLATEKFKRIALGDAKSVPAGIYAKEYLQKLNLWEQLRPKIVPMSNVRAALAAVESGDADAGFVYKTDALLSKKTRVAFEVPRRESPAISYPLALMKSARESKAARAFLDYLDSPAAGRIFAKFDFIVDTPAP